MGSRSGTIPRELVRNAGSRAARTCGVGSGVPMGDSHSSLRALCPSPQNRSTVLGSGAPHLTPAGHGPLESGTLPEALGQLGFIPYTHSAHGVASEKQHAASPRRRADIRARCPVWTAWERPAQAPRCAFPGRVAFRVSPRERHEHGRLKCHGLRFQRTKSATALRLPRGTALRLPRGTSPPPPPPCQLPRPRQFCF